MYVNIISIMRRGHESITPPSSDRNFGDLASELAAEQFIPSSSARAMVSYVIAKACRGKRPHVIYRGPDEHPDEMFQVAQAPIAYRAKTEDCSLSIKYDTVAGWLYTPRDQQTRTVYEYEDEEGDFFFKEIHYTPLGTSLSSLIRGEHVLQLSEGELGSIRDSSSALQRTLGKIGMGQREISSEQYRDAHHFSKNGTAHERGDFDALRVHVPGGARGAEIANEVLSDDSVDVLGGKVWVPNMWRVQSFRKDAPIFLVNNFDSLAGLVGKLRSLDLDGPVPTVGAPVSGTEGVFVGQDLGSGTTFSDSSNKMFQSAMEQAIGENNLRSGEYITLEWRERIARRMVQIAMASADGFGFSSYHHAFHEDPKTIDEILKIIS
jgi:hypothetical protein